MHDFDLNLDEIAKIEGQAALTIKVRNNQVEELKFKITEFKRFYTQAVRGKPVAAIPQLVARICGTCSNAHLLCSLEAIEKALKVSPSAQTLILRRLLMNGLIIRDHALHLYIFALPDLFNQDSLLDFDENDPLQNQLLQDAFLVKSAGNKLSKAIGGRSVHAPWPTIGGLTKIPDLNQIKKLIPLLEEARDPVLRLIKVLQDCPFNLKESFEYVALKSDHFNFLEGQILTSLGRITEEKNFGEYLNHTVIPYSQASAYKLANHVYLVGALARLNLTKGTLHPQTKKDLGDTLNRFPSDNVFNNNLAQAIEILECLNQSLELIQALKLRPEKPQSYQFQDSVGVGVIEAPRGLLFYKLEINAKGKINQGQIVVPTGQNQIAIEKSLYQLVQANLNLDKDRLIFEIEKLIRAYDPCMSCATHFLKVRWI